MSVEANYVQERIADYLNDLVNIGVTGLRFDAAKHMAAGDMAGILSRVNLDGVFVFSVCGIRFLLEAWAILKPWYYVATVQPLFNY